MNNQKKQKLEFVVAVLNHFAVNLGHEGLDWRDYYEEEDIERWLKEYKDA